MRFYLSLFLILGITFPTFSQLITPTIVSTKCTEVSSNSISFSPGNTPIVTAGRLYRSGKGATFYSMRTYVEYDLASLNIPSQAIIISANLKMYIEYSSPDLPVFYTNRVENSWSESTLVWSNQPSYNSTSGDQITTSSISSGWLTINVTNHVQKMIAGVYENNGWVIKQDVETGTIVKNRSFRSDDYPGGTSFHPKLEIVYYIPMSVADVLVTHQSSDGSNDGSISPTLQDGPGGSYSYQWYDKNGVMSGKISLNLEGVPCGWYGLKVTSNVSGSVPFYYSFLVGHNCHSCPFTYNPGPNFIDDAQIAYSSTSTLNGISNNGSNAYIAAGEFLILGTTVRGEGLFNSRVWIDPNIRIIKSDLFLSGNSHNPLSRPNDAELKLVTSEWNENIVTYTSAPTTNSTIDINMYPTTTSNENRTVDMKDYFEFWQQDNTNNFGILFKLDSYTNQTTVQQYSSSDNSDPAEWPKLNFEIFVFDSECQPYSELKRMIDGGYSSVIGGNLYFTLDEEYEQSSNKYLPFKIYDKNHLILESSDIDGNVLNSSISPLSLEFDDNRWVLDISGIPGIVVGDFYTIEVSNSKNDKRYLRFYYKN